MQFLNSIKSVVQNYKPYDKWEQDQADERAKKEYLAANTEIPKDKLDLVTAKAQAVVRAAEIMDAKSEDNCENMEFLTGFINAGIMLVFSSATLLPFWAKYKSSADSVVKSIESKDAAKKAFSKFIKSNLMFIGFTAISTFALSSLLQLWGTSKQKEASRIGRFQAKNNELQNLENFVVYTPEQIEKAQQIAQTLPDEKDSKNIFKIFKELKQLSNDKKAYKEWTKNHDPEEIKKLIQKQYTPEQLKKGKENQELIVDTVKEINIKAEEFSENLENAFDTINMVDFLLTIPAGFVLNKILKKTKLPTREGRILSAVLPLMIATSIAFKGTTEQKKSARIGRYYARKDLLKNPARLLAFSDEEMKKAEHIKANDQKVGFFKKIGQNFKFLWDYFKLKKEYNQYRKTEKQNNEKLQKAFKQIKITDAQKAEAQELKENVFRAFDEIDEMSQRYSEDTEAGCEIAKQGFSQAISFTYNLSPFLIAYGIIKGKISLPKMLNRFVKLTFKQESSIRQSADKLTKEMDKRPGILGDLLNALIEDNDKFFNELKSSDLGKAALEFKNNIKETVSTKKMVFHFITGGKIKDLFKDHLKQGFLGNWFRNILYETAKIFAINKIGTVKNNLEKMSKILGENSEDLTNLIKDVVPKIKIGDKEIDPAQLLNQKEITQLVPQEVIDKIQTKIIEKLGLNFTYKNYKTLINTAIATFVPTMAILLGIPFAISSWLTNIQKKAGKIGIMKAMENIDDPRVFAPQKDQAETTQGNMQETNLLKKFLNKKMAA